MIAFFHSTRLFGPSPAIVRSDHNPIMEQRKRRFAMATPPRRWEITGDAKTTSMSILITSITKSRHSSQLTNLRQKRATVAFRLRFTALGNFSHGSGLSTNPSIKFMSVLACQSRSLHKCSRLVMRRIRRVEASTEFLSLDPAS